MNVDIFNIRSSVLLYISMFKWMDVYKMNIVICRFGVIFYKVVVVVYRLYVIVFSLCRTVFSLDV